MHRPIFGHSLAVLVAPILLSVLAFYFLNKKKASKRENAKDADSGACGSMTAAMGTNAGGSSSSPTETNNGASSSTIEDSYEVFLSFRGPDTRNSFADYLYNGLIDASIHVFRDSEKICHGEEIGPNLLAAIKNSKIFIPILSESYGESRWCLNELVQIMECKNNNTETILLPIFYKVSPTDVRHQTGSFGEAFHKSERKRSSDPTTLENWKQALRGVSDLKGLVVDGPEAIPVKSVVRQVLIELKKKFELLIPENLVGIDKHVKKVMERVDKNSHGPLFVGIFGMGGIGKTTLAKTIYNKLSDKFKHRSFVADVKESWKCNSILNLQNQILNDILKQENLVHNKDEGVNFLSSKLKGEKVLILLDDVDDDGQLKVLAGNRKWFSSRSVIIITTRYESILDRASMDYKHKIEELDKNKSSILFSRHAFRQDTPPNEFKELTDEVLSIAGGLPLSLEVLGSFFCGKKETEWGGRIEKLRKIPDETVQKTLRISYEALDYGQKQIFLDVACFFSGTDWRIASYMWQDCGSYLKVDIEELRFMSLIKIEDDHKLRMHDQLRDLGRFIVREGNENKPQDCSRLWDSKEVLEILEKNEATEKIEAISLSEDSSNGLILTGKQFRKLKNLRFLVASGAHFRGDFKNSVGKLKWLQWQYCPTDFEASNFHVKELAVLDLSSCKISDKWQGWSFIKMATKLKYLNLRSCRCMKKTSFLSAFENLEVLILFSCSELEQIDSSIGKMKSLERLELWCSHKVKELPIEVGKLEALEQLRLIYCHGISSLPDSIGDLQKLKILEIGCARLKGLPAEVGKLKALEQLNLTACRGVSSLPDSIRALQNLEILRISGTGIKELPDGIGDLQSLEILIIADTLIKELPNGIGRLRRLRDLQAWNCRHLGGEIGESIRNLSSLQSLNLSGCWKLPLLSVLPSSLTELRITCQIRRWSTLSNCTHLKALFLEGCEFLECECIKEHPTKILEKSLNTPSELEISHIQGCNLMKTMDVSQFNHLTDLSAHDCNNILEIRGLDKLKYLECLSIKRCNELRDILGLEESTSLERIYISDCPSIEILPDLSSCTNLIKLSVQSCEKLTELRGLKKLEKLMQLDISDCKSLRTIPKLSEQ